jgi:cytoskeletal protein CcmA (bactofilin family)
MAWGSRTGSGDTPMPSSSGGRSGALSFIGNEVTITGNINASGDMHIDGTIEGDIDCGQIILGASGRVKGNVTANRATIGGTVEGTVTASELLVERTASLSGDLSYDSISIETGARVDGRLTQKAGAGLSAANNELKLVSAVNE